MFCGHEGERHIFCWGVSHVCLAVLSAAITNGQIFVWPNACNCPINTGNVWPLPHNCFRLFYPSGLNDNFQFLIYAHADATHSQSCTFIVTWASHLLLCIGSWTLHLFCSRSSAHRKCKQILVTCRFFRKASPVLLTCGASLARVRCTPSPKIPGLLTGFWNCCPPLLSTTLQCYSRSLTYFPTSFWGAPPLCLCDYVLIVVIL